MRHSSTGLATLCAVLLGMMLLAGVPSSAAAQAPLPPDIEAFVEEMVQKHQFRSTNLRRIFAQVQPRPAIIRAMTAPRTARPWHEFRLAYITPSRIDGGVRFWQEHAVTLARASREYGVPEELIVATIGVETLYGRNTGTFRVLDALATLAFQYPPRAEFFRGELEEFLLLTREAGFDPLALKGSFAGAMGIPQFLPSSYRKYAVDFNGDGKRDLLDTPADAIGSVANYYRSFGWRAGEATAVPADPGATAVDTAAGIKPEMKVAELRKRGIIPLAAVSDEAEAVLFVVETESGPRHFLGLNNFYVITRYNRSVNYAMAVMELAREVREAKQRPR